MKINVMLKSRISICMKLGQIKLWSPKFSLSKLNVQMTCCQRTIDINATTKEKQLKLQTLWAWNKFRVQTQCYWRTLEHLILSGHFHFHIYKRDLKWDVQLQLLEKGWRLLQARRWISPPESALITDPSFWCTQAVPIQVPIPPV